MTADPRGPGVTAIVVLATLLVPAGGAVLADDPKPAPSPVPQAFPPPAPAPSTTPAAKPDAAAPSPDPEVRVIRSVFGTIMGTVFDSKKKPLSGWMVQLSSRGDEGRIRVTGTDDKGQYVFKDLPAGTYAVEIQSENEAARTKDRIEVRPPFRNIVDFQVAPGQQAPQGPNALAAAAQAAVKAAGEAGRADGAGAPADAAGPLPVRGTFLDAQKRPVAEVSVTLVALSGKGTFQAFSGDDGTFTVAAVPAGHYRVVVFSPGYVPIDLKSIEVGPPNGLDLSLALVDYPLNTKERPEDRLPRERPLPAPSTSSTSGPS